MIAPVVILGGGVAGGHLCRSLRAKGVDAPIILISSEEAGPYERPALTKSYLSGRKSAAEIRMLDEAAVERLDVDLRLGVECISISPSEVEIDLSNNSRLIYSSLVIATGLSPRRLAGLPDGIDRFALRTTSQIDALKAAITGSQKRVVIIGAGWLGLEVAAHLSTLSHHVTVIDVAPAICSRNAPKEISGAIELFHRKRGVDFRLGAGITTIKRLGASGSKITLESGDSIECDLLVEAIGVESTPIPSGGELLWSTQGIPVNGKLQTNCANIYGIGDVALVQPSFSQTPMRVETWANAIAQAEHVAAVISGEERNYEVDTWFWSDHDDLNVQVVGAPHLADRVETTSDKDGGSMFRYFRNETLIGAASVNSFRGMKIAKREIPRSSFTCT